MDQTEAQNVSMLINQLFFRNANAILHILRFYQFVRMFQQQQQAEQQQPEEPEEIEQQHFNDSV